MLAGPSQRGEGELAPMAEINVTPLVDVMLVLLIIFMVTAPLVTAGVDVSLPQNRAKQIASDQKPIEISVNSRRQLFIGSSEVPADQLGPALQGLAQGLDPAAARVFIRADRTLDYGFVMNVVGQVSAAGFTKVAFLSDPRGAVGSS